MMVASTIVPLLILILLRTRYSFTGESSFFPRHNSKHSDYSDEKSPAGKCDCHTMGDCHEVRDLLLS